jgi:hypothetical protein
MGFPRNLREAVVPFGTTDQLTIWSVADSVAVPSAMAFFTASAFVRVLAT